MISPSCFTPERVTLFLMLSVGLILPLASVMAQTTDLPTGAAFPNNSGAFVDSYDQVADTRGLDGVLGYGRGTAFADIDSDGDDDLFVGDTDGRFFGAPYGMSMIYVNDGSGNFVPGEFNLDPADFHATWVGSFADYDDDGDPDLMVGNGGYTASSSLVLLENRINQNQGFVNVTRTAGLDSINHVKLSPTDTNPMGNEGRLARRQARLNGPAGEEDAGILPYENTMGLGVGDFYDDGFPDIVIGTGEPEFVAADIFLCNLGQRRFQRCTDKFIDPDSDHIMTRGHGAAFADVNRDGFTDFYFNLGGHPNYDFARKTESRETNKLFMRQTEATANAAWLTLSGTNSNRDAIGARIRYGEGDLARYHYVRSTQGFQSQNSMTLVIQLGDQETVPVFIDWPSGTTTELTIATGEYRNVME